YWFIFTISFLWKNPLKYCKHDKNNSLKQIIYYFLTPEKQLNYEYEFQIDKPPIFNYLKYIEEIDDSRISDLFETKKSNLISIIVNLLVKSSN
ncbi:21300_t:CDS:1, partial [Cetraspora pellucida]